MKALSYIQLDDATGEISGVIRSSGDWITPKNNVIRMDELPADATPETHYIDVSPGGIEVKRKEIPASDPRFPIERLQRPERPAKKV